MKLAEAISGAAWPSPIQTGTTHRPGGLVSALGKVLKLAQDAPVAPDGADLVRSAAGSLERLALQLAKSSAKGKGDDGDGPPWLKGKKGKGDTSPGKGKKKKSSDDDEDEDDEDDDAVEACQALVLEAMVALSSLAGAEELSLSVLTQAQREKPSAHTIAGTTDYPIPDKVHLAAAVARYKQGSLAGHPASVVKKHILSRARALGEQVELADPSAEQVVIALARGYNEPKYPAGKERLIPMEHAAHTGTHRHAYRDAHVVEGDHHHNNDNRHGIYGSAIY